MREGHTHGAWQGEGRDGQTELPRKDVDVEHISRERSEPERAVSAAPPGASTAHVHVDPQDPPPPPPIPMRTVNSPTTMLLGGGNGISACGSVTRSPTRAAGLPSISTIPEPPSGIGAVMPGPWGAPSQTGGGALGIGQVC